MELSLYLVVGSIAVIESNVLVVPMRVRFWPCLVIESTARTEWKASMMALNKEALRHCHHAFLEKVGYRGCGDEARGFV